MGACCATEESPKVETVAEPKVAADSKALAEGTPAPSETKAAPIQFTVKVEKAGENTKVGLDVVQFPSAAEGKYLKVVKVKEGLVEQWNKDNADAVSRDDYIVRVNGVATSSKAMLEEIQKSTVLDLTIS